MSFLQPFNFSSPFGTLPNFGGFGVGNGVVQHLNPSSISTQFSSTQQNGASPTRASPLSYTTAANNLLVNRNPQSPATAAAAQIPIPQSIVPNYNPNAPTDFYGNPNENYANQRAPIPPEYQQQQIQQQQLQLQQQQLQLQQQQQLQLQQQQQQQLQQQGHNLVKLKPHVLQVVPEEGQQQQRSRNRDDNKDGFDVIVHDTSDRGNSGEQVASAEIDPNLPPTQQPRRGRRRNRKPPQVINYTPVKHVEYYAPIGGHHVQLHSSSQKFSLHEVLEDPNQNSGQQTAQLNVGRDGQVSINPAGTRGASIPNIGSANNEPSGRNSNAGPGPGEFGINISGPQPQQQQQAPAPQNVNNAQTNLGPGIEENIRNTVESVDNANVISGPPETSNAPRSRANSAENDDDATIVNSDSSINNGENINNSNNVINNDGAGPTNNNQQTPAPTSGAESNEKLRVTPIQGPIYAKDGMAPVVPLYSYNSVKNGTLYQIPILWTALSYALGLEIHGEILRGLPCIKRLNQLYCPSAGTNYPLEKIEGFIDENKALIRRMYGDFIMSSEAYVGPPGSNTLRRSTRDVFEEEVPDLFLPSNTKNKKNKRAAHHNDKHNLGMHAAPDDDHITVTLPPGNGTSKAHVRATRQTVNNRNGGPSQQPRSNRVDSCESTVEIVTPYWAANSGGKVRAIVNTQHFEQAIHQEVCRHTSTRRCSGDCGCEQKYKWHRLLAYDADNDCRGIFMDWFLFPSCCVCRCNPSSQS